MKSDLYTNLSKHSSHDLEPANPYRMGHTTDSYQAINYHQMFSLTSKYIQLQVKSLVDQIPVQADTVYSP